MPRKLYEWRDHLRPLEQRELERLERKLPGAKVRVSEILEAIQIIRAKAVQRARHHAKKQEKEQ